MTTDVESVIGTSGNDTIDGSTANSVKGDTISDPSTSDNDTADLLLTSSIAAADRPTITNVENIDLDFGNFGLSFDAGGVSSGHVNVTTSKALNTAATIDGIANKGVTFGVDSTIETFNIDGTTNTDDSTSVTLAGGTLSLNVGGTADALETVDLVSSGSANTVKLEDNGDGTKSTAISGDQSITIETDLDDLDGDTITDTTTGGTTTIKNNDQVGAAVDLKSVDVMNWDLAADTNGQVLTFKAGTQNVTLNHASASNGTFTADGSGTTDTVNFTANKAMGDTLKTAGFETVNITNAFNGAQTLTSAVFTSDGAINGTNSAAVSVFGSENFTFANSVDAKSIDGSGLTGSAQLSVTDADLKANGSLTGADNGDTLIVKSIDGATDGTTDRVTLNGGGGNDTIKVTVASNATFDTEMNGGSSNDTITGGDGDDTILGGEGEDSINANEGNNFVFGEGGNDTVTLDAGTDKVDMGAGDDEVVGGSNLTSADTLEGGAGTDLLGATSNAGSATMFDNVSGFENIDLTLAGAAVVNTTDGLVASGQKLDIDVTSGGSKLTFVGSAESDGYFDITVTCADQGEAHDVTMGSGNDTLTFVLATATATSGAAAFDGNAGADTLDLTGFMAADAVSGFTMSQNKGDSQVVTSVTNGMSLSSADVVKFGNTASDGFKIDTGNANIVSADGDLIIGATDGTMPGALQNDQAYLIDGTYNSATKTFSAGGADEADALFVYDADDTANTQFEVVVLVGVTPAASTAAAGVLTILDA